MELMEIDEEVVELEISSNAVYAKEPIVLIGSSLNLPTPVSQQLLVLPQQ